MANNRNYKNPTVQAWESLKLFMSSFMDRMNSFEEMVQRQGRDIGIDEVFNQIQIMKQELNKIQKELNLYNNTIPIENQGVNPPQPQNESKYHNKVRLSESQLHKVIKECVKTVLNETIWKTYGKEYSPNLVVKQFMNNIKNYLDCPTAGAFEDLKSDMIVIKRDFPQIDVFNVVSKVVKNYSEDIEESDYVKNKLLDLVSSM